jgi:hypothetical protein
MAPARRQAPKFPEPVIEDPSRWWQLRFAVRWLWAFITGGKTGLDGR